MKFREKNITKIDVHVSISIDFDIIGKYFRISHLKNSDCAVRVMHY